MQRLFQACGLLQCLVGAIQNNITKGKESWGWGVMEPLPTHTSLGFLPRVVLIN